MKDDTWNGFQAGDTRLLTFQLGETSYAVDVIHVREIIQVTRITRVPGASRSFRGVVNLRGRVIPVMDLCERVQAPAVESLDRRCIIILEIPRNDQTITLGVLVDRVQEVIQVDQDSIQQSPGLNDEGSQEMLLGVLVRDEGVSLVLDVKGFLNPEDLESIMTLGRGLVPAKNGGPAVQEATPGGPSGEGFTPASNDTKRFHGTE